MLGLIIFIFQVSAGDNAVLAEGTEVGSKIVLENTRFEETQQVKWGTRIFKFGDRLRIEETFSNSEEVAEVIIWDGKQCRLLMPNNKIQVIPPIRNGIEFIGFKDDVKDVQEEKTKWITDKATKLPVKKETQTGITEYKDYVLIENFGYFPNVIEEYENGKISQRTELKGMDKKLELSPKLFDYRNVEFSKEAIELAKKHNFE